MIKKRKLDFIAFGIDSSNHGTDPEIFVAVASTYREDTEILPGFEKMRNPSRIQSFLRKRDYRFMVVSRQHYETYGNHQLIAYVCRDLISSFPFFEDSTPVEIYIDGEVRKQERNLAKYLLSERAVYPSFLISVKEVPKEKINKTNTLIAIADGQAHNLFRNKTLDELTQGNLSMKRVILK